MVAALADYDKLLPTLAAWLERHERLSGTYDPDRDLDFGGIWRPSIGDHPQNYGFGEIGEALVDVVRDLAAGLLAAGTDVATVVEVLERRKVTILQRIALFALSQRAPTDTPAQQFARDRVLDPRLLEDPGLYHEYLELAAATLEPLSDADYRGCE